MENQIHSPDGDSTLPTTTFSSELETRKYWKIFWVSMLLFFLGISGAQAQLVSVSLWVLSSNVKTKPITIGAKPQSLTLFPRISHMFPAWAEILFRYVWRDCLEYGNCTRIFFRVGHFLGLCQFLRSVFVCTAGIH